jgi:hypothetical protein
MAECKDCIHYVVCDPYTEDNEDFAEVGGCTAFKNKADFVEVRHGYWKDTIEELGYHDVCVAECSVCGESWVLDGDFDFDICTEYWHYCPNCSAKMDGKGEGE